MNEFKWRKKNIGESGNLAPHLLWVMFSHVNEAVLAPTGTRGCGSYQRLSIFSQYSLFPFCFSVLRVFEALLLYGHTANTITYAQQHCTSGTKQGGEVRQHLSADGTRTNAAIFSSPPAIQTRQHVQNTVKPWMQQAVQTCLGCR